MLSWNNKIEAGFTFIEAILQLVTFIIIMTTILLIFPWYEKTEESILATNGIEFEVFLSELRVDLLNATNVRVVGNTEFEIQREIAGDPEHFIFVNYQCNNKMIKKSYVTKGVDIKLTRVKNCEFVINDNKLTIVVYFINKLRKESSLVF